MKRVLFSMLLAAAAAGTASADCEYQGRTYSQGSTICAAGGWLEECTVAGYWKAIGQCRAADADNPTKYTVIESEEPAATPSPEATPEKSD